MRIAQVSPLFESVPPKLYGGIERMVSYLTDELVDFGHQVTLFASGDSRTRARLAAPVRTALRFDPYCWDQQSPHLLMLEQVFRLRKEFDIVHFHLEYLQFPFTRREPLTHLTTVHCYINTPQYIRLFHEYTGEPLVSISQAQRGPLHWANWKANIYHGLPEHLHHCRPEPGSYLAFLGRIAPEKGLEHAIQIARQSGMPLRIAAKVDPADTSYYETRIKPLLDDPLIDYIGEVDEQQKGDFLGHAAALLFPINWPEPFGLVMIEAMACGTPVIAFANGSVPEVMEHGKTGFVVDSIESAVAAVARLGEISRPGCREVFERRFTARRMAMEYLKLYRSMLLF